MKSVPPRGSGWVRSLFCRSILSFAPTRYREVVLTLSKQDRIGLPASCRFDCYQPRDWIECDLERMQCAPSKNYWCRGRNSEQDLRGYVFQNQRADAYGSWAKFSGLDIAAAQVTRPTSMISAIA